MSGDPDNGIMVIDEWCELHRVDGAWHEVRFGQNADAPLTKSVFDALKRKHVWPGVRYAKSCRRLTDGELVARGLENERRSR